MGWSSPCPPFYPRLQEPTSGRAGSPPTLALSPVPLDSERSKPFYFFNRHDRDTEAQTWQVLRSEFDQMLLDKARERGAEVREEAVVNRLCCAARVRS